MSTVELKLCPFCGGGASYVKHSAGMPGTMGFDSWHAVACRSCGGTVGACDRRFRSKDDAAGAWNVRPSVDDLMALIYLYGQHVAEHPQDLKGATERLRAIKACAAK